MKFAMVVMIAVASSAAQTPVKEESTDSIIERLKKNPSDSIRVGELARRSDPQVIPVLRELFIQAKLSGATGPTGPTSQVVAAHLMHLGVKDDLYFNELAGYVSDDIAADPPEPYVYDAKGNTTRRNTAFEQWCAIRKLDFDTCTGKSLGFVADFGLLAMSNDQRAIPVFREALSASSAVMVDVAVAVLSRFNDARSIPLIAKDCARLPPQAAEEVATTASRFDDPAVVGLFDRDIRDPETRDKVKKEWLDRRNKTDRH